MRLSYYDSTADVLLMAIPNLIPDHFHTFLLGFNASELDVPETAIAIHHPGGAPAAVSTVQGRCAQDRSQHVVFLALVHKCNALMNVLDMINHAEWSKEHPENVLL